MMDRPSDRSDSVSRIQSTDPYTKLTIAYLGIMAGLAVIGLVFYIIASRGGAPGSLPVQVEIYYGTIGFFIALISNSLLGLWQLVRGRRLGAYLAFIALAMSVFAPYSNQRTEAILFPIYWIAIPNMIVSLLLLKSLKTLR